MNFKTGINRLANIGISTEMTTEQEGLLKLSNKMAWYTLLFCSFLGIIGLFISEYITAIYDFTIAIVIFIPIILNYYKLYTAAKLMLIFSAILSVIFGSLIYGYDSVFKYLMILPISIIFIFFSEKRKWKLYFLISITILTLVFFEIDKFVNHNYTFKNFNHGFSEFYMGHIFESLTFMLLIAIYILMQSYYRSILKKKERELIIYKKIFDNSHEGLSIIDPTGRYVKQNNALERILGFTDKELVSETPAIHMGEELYNKIEETIEETGKYTGEFISKTKLGEKHIDLMAFEIIENNKILCLVAIYRDVTNHKTKAMRIFITLFMSLVLLTCSTDKRPKDLVEYLSTFNNKLPQMKASDYIIDLFKEYDYVIITERSHPEKTQYDLFLEIINNEYFISNVGTVFTEVGSVSAESSIEKFLKKTYLSDTLRQNELIELYKNLTFSPVWEKYNFYYFLDSLNKLNATLSDSLKIQLFPSDIVFNGWETIKSETDYSNVFKNMGSRSRDSIIAKNIFKHLDGKKSKALIIMNYRHGFGTNVKNILKGDTIDIPCVGKLLKDKYGSRVAHVLLNCMAYLPFDNIDKNDSEIPIQNGLWDATFKFIGMNDIGFSFANTRFGDDTLDIWPYFKDTLRYKDVFTGFAYYKALNEHVFIDGIPNLMTDDFEEEFKRRTLIVQKVWNYDDSGIKSNIDDDIEYLKHMNTYYYENLDSKMDIIDKWIK